MTLPTTVTPHLAALIGAIRTAVRSGVAPATVAGRVAESLRPYLNQRDLLTPEQRVSNPARYQQHILHVEGDGSFSIVSLVWLPGQATPIHDHVSWCVVGVHEGQEHESQYRLVGEGSAAHLIESGHSSNPTGTVAAYAPPGDIHKVTNRGPGLAISLHVYGADIGKLGSSIRRRYDLTVKGDSAHDG
jgi:predicted metal-dependent enzyme (double-stranded beta helix superfamily)